MTVNDELKKRLENGQIHIDNISSQVWVKNPSNDKIENFLEKVFGTSLFFHG